MVVFSLGGTDAEVALTEQDLGRDTLHAIDDHGTRDFVQDVQPAVLRQSGRLQGPSFFPESLRQSDGIELSFEVSGLCPQLVTILPEGFKADLRRFDGPEPPVTGLVF